MGTEPGSTTPEKKTRKGYKRSDSTLYVTDPIAPDTTVSVFAGPFSTIKKCRAAMPKQGDYDIICVREQLSADVKTTVVVRKRK